MIEILPKSYTRTSGAKLHKVIIDFTIRGRTEGTSRTGCSCTSETKANLEHISEYEKDTLKTKYINQDSRV